MNEAGIKGRYAPSPTMGHRLFAILAAVVLLAGCASSTATPAPAASGASAAPGASTAPVESAAPATPAGPASGGILKFAIAQPVDSLDPAIGTTSSTSVVIQSVFDRLVWAKPGDPKYYPGLAESWDVSSDLKSYTFHLRKDVKFHDGTPFNAAAVKFNFDRMVDPATKSGIAVGALGPYESSTVIDDSTIQVNFKAPNASLLTQLGTVWLAPSSPTAIAKYGADYQDHLVGTGPYMLKEYIHTDHITLARNPDYTWGPEIFKHQGPGYVDEIEYRMIAEDSTRVAALQSGEEDVVDRIPAPDFERLKADSNYQTLVASTGGAGWHLTLNLDNPPTDDPAVRAAIGAAVNPKEISDTIFKGTLPAIDSILEHNTLGYNPDQGIIKFDPAAAGTLLDNDGWVMGSDGIRAKGGKPLTVVLFAWTGFGMDEMSIAVQGQLKKVGIDVQIKTLDFGAGVTAMQAKTQHNFSWTFGWYADPSILDVFFRCKPATVFNYSFTCDPALDKLMDDGIAAPNDAARAAIYDKVVVAVEKSGAAIPFFAKATVLAANKTFNIGDVFVNPEGYPIFYDVSKQ